MPKISIIVPVFKAEKYIHRCVESILNQTFKDFELLLIDDGSPDLCPKLCDDLALTDNRIKVFHKKNGGVSSARNFGLDNATGKYVTFVDSDDYIDNNMYESMVDIAEKHNCDFVMCDCIKEFPDHSELYTHNISEGYYDFNRLKKEYYKQLLITEDVEYPATISNCLCLFKPSDKIRYIEGVRYSEDWLFGAQMIYNSKSFYYMKGCAFYHYCMNPTSATHSFVKDKWNDYKKLFSHAYSYFHNQEQYNFDYQLNLMLLFLLYNAVSNIRSSNLTKTEKKLLLSDILSDTKVRSMFKSISIIKLKISWKLKIYTYFYKFKLINILLFL